MVFTGGQQRMCKVLCTWVQFVRSIKTCVLSVSHHLSHYTSMGNILCLVSSGRLCRWDTVTHYVRPGRLAGKNWALQAGMHFSLYMLPVILKVSLLGMQAKHRVESVPDCESWAELAAIFWWAIMRTQFLQNAIIWQWKHLNYSALSGSQ